MIARPGVLGRHVATAGCVPAGLRRLTRMAKKRGMPGGAGLVLNTSTLAQSARILDLVLISIHEHPWTSM